uniref:Cytochrome b6-f complex subunit PetP n=1 Tax=Laurencieae sp. TaxID=2007162 RepID=A0A1Z1M2D3_9FLOR|nr:cytochrome b6-f complex subunit PetP [Laurencieae sp.]
MKKHIVNIKTIPSTLKTKLISSIYKKIFLAGYKKISSQYKTPIIELPNKKRMWVLKYEIKYKKTI